MKKAAPGGGLLVFLDFLNLERAGNKHAHDLIRPTINALNTGIGIHTANRIFVHIAVAAEELQAIIDDFVFAFGAPKFCRCRAIGVELAL